jgi:glycosyltransferase involved in cell wall biosynthesis
MVGARHHRLMPALVVSWTPANARSAGLAEALHAQVLFAPGAILRPRTAPLRYLRAGISTWRRTVSLRPSALIVMLPPAPAAVVAWLLARRLAVPLVLDLHNGVFDDPKWAWSWPLLRPLARRCRATLVTTAELAGALRAQGLPAVVVPDPPEPRPAAARRDPDQPARVVVVSGWNNDEPVAAVLDAAARLDGAATVLATGQPPRRVRARAGATVQFPGWLPRAAYLRMLDQADVVVALTTQPRTMLRGGYEALDARRPLVTSDTPALRAFFGDAALYAPPSGPAIAAAIRSALERRTELAAAMTSLAEQRERAWPAALAELTRLLPG